MPLILGANSLAGGGYEVDNSCRFDGTSSYLSKTPGSTSNRQKWTYSAWVKKSNINGLNQKIFEGGVDGNTLTDVLFKTDESFRFYSEDAGITKINFVTNRLFRDPSAWYHIVVAVDTTQGTDTNRVKLYVNGVQETSFATATYPAVNYNTIVNYSSAANVIGRRSAYGDFDFGGYLSETVLIDGTQLDPTSFGEFDEDSGIWKPISVSGLTFGTNGFYLDFKDSANLGNDASGGTDFTESGITAIDQTTDTPTNNFATWNPLVKTSSTVTISEGNTIGTEATNGSYFGIVTNMFPTSGKWYGEMKFTSLGTVQTGFITEGTFIDGDRNLYSSSSSLYWQSGTTSISTVLNSSGVTTVVSGGSNSTSAFNSTNDIIMYAWDVDNGRAWFGINGTWQNSGNPAGPTNWWSLPSDYAAGVSLFTTLCGCGVGTATVNLNTGNPPFTGTDKTDGNSRGSFEYQPPSGFFSLCTANLSEALS